MATFEGAVAQAAIASPFTGRVAATYTHAPQLDPVTGLLVDDPGALDPTGYPGADSFTDEGQQTVPPELTFEGFPAFMATPAFDFFEHFHVVPRSFAFGNILTTQTEPIEVFSAFRDAVHSWDSFVNNAGAGVTLLGQPALPTNLNPLTGIVMTLEVSTSGAPKVDTTLDFTFDVGTAFVPITLDRVVLWAVQPELPYVEFLQFLTEVMTHKNASEQRHSLRVSPRQVFRWNLILEDGEERSRIHNILFDWQTQIFGLPLWHELTRMATPAVLGATVITVQSTAYADYRVGGLVLIYESQTTFDVLELVSTTATTLTLKNATLNAYAAGVLVMPLRTAVLEGKVAGARFPSSDAELRVQFRVKDVGVDLADVSPFSSFNSKVLLDELNGLSGTMAEFFQRQVIKLDSETGLTFQESTWDRGKRGTAKTFLLNTKQGVWEVRGLLHALRGRQISFYLPSFSEDFTVVGDLTSGSTQMTIVNVSYTQFVQSRQPRNVLRVVFNDGSATLIRTIVSSVVASVTEETLTLDTTWPSTFTNSQIARVEIVEKVRWNSDTMQIRYALGDRTVKVLAPVKTVNE